MNAQALNVLAMRAPVTAVQPLVIGLGYRARNGKDTAADAMAARAQGRFCVHVLRFSDELYRMCREFFGMGEKDAVLLQRVGTDLIRRHYDEDFWVKALDRHVRMLVSEDWRPSVVLIPDMRFPNEMAWVKEQGGWTVDVQRWRSVDEPKATACIPLPLGLAVTVLNGRPVVRYVADDRPAGHPSEAALDDAAFDYTIQALSGDVGGLQRGAVEVFENILERR